MNQRYRLAGENIIPKGQTPGTYGGLECLVITGAFLQLSP